VSADRPKRLETAMVGSWRRKGTESVEENEGILISQDKI